MYKTLPIPFQLCKNFLSFEEGGIVFFPSANHWEESKKKQKNSEGETSKDPADEKNRKRDTRS